MGRLPKAELHPEQQASTSTALDGRTARELLKLELKARVLNKARAFRDLREILHAKISEYTPEELANEMRHLDTHVEEHERRSTGGLVMEDLLKDPEYNRESLEDLIPNLPRKELKELLRSDPQDEPLPPIDIKIDDGGARDAKEEGPHSMMSMGEGNVEKAAKMEAHVVQRVAELRKQGLWTMSRLPLCVDPPRNKTQWDYLLEEVKWMANDFRQERNFKRNMAKKYSQQIAKIKRDQEMEVERAEQKVLKEGRKICANIAKMVRDFWQNVDKVVEFRAQEILESKKRKALDQHLAFIVGEADKLSSMVQEGLTQEKSSKTPSVSSKQDQDDREFTMNDDDVDSDNESTLSKEEEEEKDIDHKVEIDALNDDAEGDIDDMLAGLPAEYLASLGITLPAKKDKRSQSSMSVATEDSVASSSMNTDEKKDDVKEEEETELNGEGNGDGRGVLKDVDYAKLNSANADEREQELAHIAEQALQFQPKGFTLETTQVKTQVPFLIRGTLREYQLVGLDWLVTLYEKNLNGILADEMGLGKTIQTISLLAHLACSESIWGPHLIVVPTSVILNWEMELKKWCPAFKILTYFGTVKERAEKRKGWSKPNAFHICITSYKTITTDIRSFKMKAWQYMILDEAQNIKNWKSQRWQALLNIRARRRLLLTGTPLQNSLMELWSLMHFLMPAIFASHDDFKDWFSNPLTGMMEGSVEYNAPLVQRLHKILRPFILRRLKSEVEKQLPEKVEKVIKCELSKRQRYLYDDFMSRRTTKENLKTGNMFSVLNIVMQLRKCCNHPNLFEPRPVLSPFILTPIRQNLPACVFDIVGEDARQEDIKPIPECLNIRDRLTGWARTDSLKKPTIEELKRWQSNKPIPVVEGFRLSVPALSRSDLSTVSSPAVSAAETQNSVGAEPGLPEPSLASLPRSSASVADKQASTQRWLQNQSGGGVQQRQIVTTSSVRTGAVRRSATIHPAFKSTIQLSSSQQNLAVLTETKGFNHVMANGGTRESIVNYDYKFSPPMKRRKFQDTPLVTGPYSAYVPQDCREHLAEERVRKLELAQGRFGARTGPVFANELVYLLTRKEEETEEFRRLPAVQKLLQEHTDTLLYKYPLYVDPVQVDAPAISAMSKGRSVQAKMSEKGMSLVARKHLEEAPSTLDSKMLASRLQFPELRLIEYDCGKLQTLALLLRQLYLYKHRCLIFTQMSRMLDILQAFLSHHGYQYFRLDGTTGIEQRQAMMERFNADNRIFCFILSTRSGGVGVNLTGADTVIFYDSDWNPTMDAQAQDRCHRIGQTRNVTIYRLISERTIEENILKKAMQKRRLGEMAIDDAGFTPDFFKEKDNIRDLFEGDVELEEVKADELAHDQKEMETAMASLEDEQDVAASKMAVAEARADRAEFDEAKRDTTTALMGGEDVDEKYIELINQLKPIERYAVQFLQEEYKPDFDVECKEAEAMISQKKEDWVRAHEKAINDETSLTDDDFYGCGSILDEVMAMDNCFPDLPTWCPPTPPISPGQMQNDLYYDDCLDLLYDPDFMGESRLPNVIHDLHRPLMRTPSPVKKQPPTPSLGSSKNKAVMDLLNAATQSACSSASQSPMYTNDSTYYPEFGFQVPDYGTMDPFAQPRKEKRDRSGKGDRGAEQAIRQSREAPRPITPPPLMHEAEDYEGPEWNIMEDMAIVEAVEIEEALGHVASRPQGALQYNWRYISDYVNMRTAPTGHYRSARQCCIRYQVVVRPREAGHLHTVDPITRKPRKVPVTPAELAHLKKNRTTTKAQFDHDYPLMMESVCVNKARLLKDLNKRNKKPQKSYLDALPAVADTKMPDNFEAKLQELKLAGALRTVLPEDMVRKQEEVHFLSVEAQSKQRATEKQLDTDVQKGMPASIAIRSSAIPAQGTRESKAPYMLEMPVIHATKPPPPPPRSVPLSNVHANTSIPQLMPADHPVSHQTTIGTSQGPRRVTNPTMSHMVSNSSGGHNYVVVNDHPNAMRVQRTETIGQQGNVPMFRGVQGQVRRAPTNTPMNQRPVNYVSSQGGQGGNYITSQQGTGNATMYSGPMTQQSRPVPPNSRVITRPGTQPNRIFVNSDRTGQYVMQQGHVRVVGAGQGVQRVQQGPSSGGVPPSQGIKRVAPKPGTVTTMVLPAGTRPPGQPGQMQQFRTIRTVQRGVSGPQQGPRVMNVVMGGGGPMRTASGHLVSSQGGMTRQLLTSRTTMPTSRQGSPQTIAQVVIAPPSGLQQSQQRDLHPSQPPTLTPQQIDPHPPPGRNSPQVQHVAVPVSSAPTASAPHDGPSPE